MLRRAVSLLVIAGAAALVFWISRSGEIERQTPAGRPSIPTREPRETEPAMRPELAPAETPIVGEETFPRKRAEPAVSAATSKEPTKTLSVSGRVVDDLGAPVPRFTIECVRPGAAESGLDMERIQEILATQGHVELDQYGELPKELRGTRENELHPFESSEGVFHLDRLEPGQWELTAHGEADRRSAPAVTSVPGAPEVVLVLSRSATITGFVVGADGAPLAGAQVYLHYPGEREIEFRFGMEPEPRARTTGAGSFRIENVSPGSAEIMARHAEYADGEWQEIAVDPGATVQGIEIELRAGGRIEGQVDPSLGDVADRQVDLFSFRGGIGWRETRTDVDGHFVIEHVMPQGYVIELRPAGYGKSEKHELVQNQPGTRKNLSVKEGETTRVLFGEARRPIAIHGLVLSGGAPAPGLTVSPYSRENEDRGEEVKTEPDGHFELTVLGAGDYRFVVSANYGSYAYFYQRVPDQSDFDLVLEVAAGVISGHVRDAMDRPLGHVGVTLVRSGYTRENFYECYLRTYTEADGSFAFRLLAPGTYTVRAPDGFQDNSPPPRVPHGRVVMTDLVIDRSQVSGIEVRLPPECRISGVVVDALGNPVTDAWVGALDSRGISLAGDGWETRTDATGHFEIESVDPGSHTVRVHSGEKEARSPSFEVEPGKTASVRVELR